MLPNMPLVQGYETLRMAFKGLFDAGVKEINLELGELIDTGDYVIERSTYTQKVHPPGSRARGRIHQKDTRYTAK